MEEWLEEVIIYTLSRRSIACWNRVQGLAKIDGDKSISEVMTWYFSEIPISPEWMSEKYFGDGEDAWRRIMRLGTKLFQFTRGSDLANLVFGADEIKDSTENTSSFAGSLNAKTSSAPSGGQHRFAKPFLMYRIKIPIEQAGTYPLPRRIGPFPLNQ